jgi:hypothetical protein
MAVAYRTSRNVRAELTQARSDALQQAQHKLDCLMDMFRTHFGSYHRDILQQKRTELLDVLGRFYYLQIIGDDQANKLQDAFDQIYHALILY